MRSGQLPFETSTRKCLGTTTSSRRDSRRNFTILLLIPARFASSVHARRDIMGPVNIMAPCYFATAVRKQVRTRSIQSNKLSDTFLRLNFSFAVFSAWSHNFYWPHNLPSCVYCSALHSRLQKKLILASELSR
ncbi:hypothetical protein RvY_15061-2 [Ramazzottius varieornatus]|uniref:Uncharacterized protein n=1 Tax=Ramazzottius varieornatus TaxID=947166 RepID=A0A1D1VTJ2_RAMVA|nr:hypothetical protein RvY_15061-2 [Ramazzottius varieornatus]